MAYTPIKACEILKQWRREALSMLNRYVFCFALSKDGILSVYTDRPGYLIGKSGCIFSKYRKLLKDTCPNEIKDVKIFEVKTA